MSYSLLLTGQARPVEGGMNPPTRLRTKQYRAPKRDEERRTVVKTPEPPAWMVKPLKPPRAAERDKKGK